VILAIEVQVPDRFTGVPTRVDACLKLAWRHELGESVRFDGELADDPHSDDPHSANPRHKETTA
jgi:hypothetical protein